MGGFLFWGHIGKKGPMQIQFCRKWFFSVYLDLIFDQGPLFWVSRHGALLFPLTWFGVFAYAIPDIESNLLFVGVELERDGIL